MTFHRQPVKLQDCHEHGPDSGAELFVVEGDSASSNVARARNDRLQAVLPMQGKPMNALKASAARVAANELFSELSRALGCGTGEDFDTRRLRYERVILLFDPDADGIHCGALMSMYFYRYLPALIDQERLLRVRAPLFRIRCDRLAEPAYAESQAHRQHIVAELERHGAEFELQHFRGLGSLDETLLRTRCLAPASRKSEIVTRGDVEMAVRVFSGIDVDMNDSPDQALDEPPGNPHDGAHEDPLDDAHDDALDGSSGDLLGDPLTGSPGSLSDNSADNRSDGSLSDAPDDPGEGPRR